MNQGLRPEQRIRKKEIFKVLFDQGCFASSKLLNLWVYQGPEVSAGVGPKLGIIVSKKTSLRANIRNLWKRRIREAFRRMQQEIAPEYAVMIQSRRREKVPEFKAIQDDLRKLLSKTKCLIK